MSAAQVCQILTAYAISSAKCYASLAICWTKKNTNTRIMNCTNTQMQYENTKIQDAYAQRIDNV